MSLYKRLQEVQGPAAAASTSAVGTRCSTSSVRRSITTSSKSSARSSTTSASPRKNFGGGSRSTPVSADQGAGPALGGRQGAADPGRLRRHPRLRTDRPVPARQGRSPKSWSTVRSACTSSARQARARRCTFVDDNHLRRIIDKIVGQVGRRIDESTPMVDARLPDGSRVNAVIHPLAIGGPFLTIRKFSADPFTVDDLIGFGSIRRRSAKFLQACVIGRLNIIISGGTGTGKTTMLNVLSLVHPRRRAHRHRRGRQGTATPPGPRPVDGSAPTQHRRSRRDHHP